MSAYFAHEKLDVYQAALKFVAWNATLGGDLNPPPKVKLAEVVDQLDRASLSILLNTAEGNGHRRRAIRAKFFDDARGSATECAACLDALVAKGAAPQERIAEGKVLLARIAAMLSKLVAMFEDQVLKEEAVEYRVGGSFEKEKECENEKDDPQR
jgi:four helix bundle protein